MEWFSIWWNGLLGSEQVFYCIAIPATLIFVIQTIMLIIGFGSGGEGVNFSDTSGIDGLDVGDMSGPDGNFSDMSDVSDGVGDGSNPSDFSILSWFTFQGIVSFFCVLGWTGLICINAGLHIGFVILIAIVCGLAAMFGVTKIIRLSAKLAQNGSIVVKNLLGETGTVYLRIPANGNGHGKIMVSTSERYLEFDAITDEKEDLGNNTQVRIVDIRGENMLVVEKAD